jgi:hypothetical protein
MGIYRTGEFGPIWAMALRTASASIPKAPFDTQMSQTSDAFAFSKVVK